MNYIIKANSIIKSYTKKQRTTPVLKGVSIDIHSGGLVSIMGPSGAGKSTLLHILGGLDSPDSGEIILNIAAKEINLSNISNSKLAKLRNEHIGFIFQFHHLLPEFSALENIMLPALIKGTAYNNAKADAEKLLDYVGLSIRDTHKQNELSGGEQQRVAIARALINKPSIIFADEPTGNLDKLNSNNIIELIKQLNQELGITFLIATHSNEVAAASNRIINIKDGLIEE